MGSVAVRAYPLQDAKLVPGLVDSGFHRGLRVRLAGGGPLPRGAWGQDRRRRLPLGRQFYADGVETHQALLGAGIWVIEGLDLSGVEPGEHELICLPLKVEGGDGAPARALLRK